jgi:hypothetical protein
MMARLAIQCVDADGQTGDFLYTGDLQTGQSPKDGDRLGKVSPTFVDLVAFYEWANANGWTSIGRNVADMRYEHA